jgi:O-methyltransferase
MNLEELRQHHLNLLKKFIIRYDFDAEAYTWREVENFPGKLSPLKAVRHFLPSNWTVAEKHIRPALIVRENGQDWPVTGESMIGLKRMNQLHSALDQITLESTPGDIVETGVWRGGAIIFCASYLNTYGITDRKVFACDSFVGLPTPDERYPVDIGDTHFTFDVLKVSVEDVRRNLEKYHLNTENVILVKGWFKDTLPSLDTECISILRLDGDMYGSTIQALEALYHKVSKGGFVIIDDFSLEGARKAVEDFFKSDKMPNIQNIDDSAAFFRKI